MASLAKLGMAQIPKIERWCARALCSVFPVFQERRDRLEKIFRYLIAGSTSALTDLILLYTLTEVFGLWYLLSAMLAFAVALVVSFLLQKFWTFADVSHEQIHIQFTSYVIYTLSMLGLNTLLVYIFVDVLLLWYMFGQILAGGLIAFVNFSVYEKFIFKRPEAEKVTRPL